MIELVKFTWRNTHGYWIPVAWTTARGGSDTGEVRSHAAIGRPGMTDLRVIDRAAIPEEMRRTGRTRSMLSNVLLYDKAADSYAAQEMVAAMQERSA